MKRPVKIGTLFVVMLSMLLACSMNTRNKVLSIFFDGVERPDTTLSGLSQKTSNEDRNRTSTGNLSRSSPAIFYHDVYQQKECDTCHDRENANKLIQELPDLCYQCHGNFSEEYEYLHVPVEMGECMACHNPHKAMQKKLLIDTVRNLCFSCHSEQDILKTDTHVAIGETPCTECHNPHGGENEYLFN